MVRAVGGLVDTVEDCDGAGRGTGFTSGPLDPEALLGALRSALAVFREPSAFPELKRRGTAVDFSWDRSAARYEALCRGLPRRVSSFAGAPRPG